MEPEGPSVEDLLPHRGRMKLIDEILELAEDRAVTRSVVADTWPLFNGEAVDAMVFIELVAQTAGINNSWVRIRRHGTRVDRKGWIVGVKSVRLFRDDVPVGACLITRAENRFAYEGFREVAGTVEIDAVKAGEVTLQLLRSELPKTEAEEKHPDGR